MAPKGKKSGGGKGKGGAAGVVDGVDPTEMTREQIEQHAVRLRQEIEREREERNFFQLERDKLRTFWEITHQQLDESRAELRNKDREMEEKQEEHEGHAKVYKQKVKHLLYEHLNDIAQLKAENMVSLKITQEAFSEQEQVLLGDKRDLKETLLEQQQQHQDEVRAIKMELSEKLSQEREHLKTEAREMEDSYEIQFKQQREQLAHRFNMELAEVEERKNRQITDLLRNHETAFAELKSYYNDITLNNLALISSLKEQMEEMKRREERMEKTLKEVQKENKSIAEPLKRAKEEATELNRQLTNYQKDKVSLAAAKQSLAAALKELDSVRWERETLQQQLTKMTAQRDAIRDSFHSAVQEVQCKAGMRSAVLERKVTVLKELLEQKEAQCAEIMAASEIDTGLHTCVSMKIEQLLADKNETIHTLQQDLARALKAHNDAIETCQAKLEGLGVSKEELGFTPLRLGVKIGKGPAGLVSLNK